MRLSFYILIISSFLCLSVVSAQIHQDLYTYYLNRQINKLEERLTQLEKTSKNHPEILFFRTALSDNGDDAFNVYERLFIQSKGPLKNLSAQKLSEYYFARGFYVKSSEYKKIAKTYIPVKTTESANSGDNIVENKTETRTTSTYNIQVGAFGIRDNADELADYLKGKQVKVSVVKREIDGKQLYCVWVEGGSDLDSTKDIADELKRKYRLSYRILKP